MALEAEAYLFSMFMFPFESEEPLAYVYERLRVVSWIVVAHDSRLVSILVLVERRAPWDDSETRAHPAMDS